MFKKGIVIFLAYSLVFILISGCQGERSPTGVLSEKPIAHIHYSWIPESFTISPDSKRVAYVAKASNKMFVVMNGKRGKMYNAIGTPIFSRDSRHLAYVAKLGDNWLVVVDGKEEKQYGWLGYPVFSPEGKRLAYRAMMGGKEFVVVDGNEGKNYDDIVTRGEGKIVFDSPHSLHYLAQNNNSIYLVQLELK
jgi:hypothetical protein